MKLNQVQYKNFLAKPDPKVKAVLVYGPDEGAVLETALALSKTVLDDMQDPFRVVVLTPASFKACPSALFDEASSISLMGGRKLIRIKDADNTITDAVSDFLDSYNGDSFVVLSAGNLLKASSLRKLAEASAKMAVIACYADDRESLKTIISEQIAAGGKKISAEALMWLAENLGADRAVTRTEIDKLITFAGDKTEISLEEAMDIVGDGSAISLEDLAYAAGEGNFAALNKSLAKVFKEDENAAVAIIRTTLYHFQRLHLIKAKINAGMRGDEALRFLFPPVNFKRENSFKRQVQTWNQDKIFKVLKLLVDTEKDCKTTGNPAEIICSRTLMQITSLAKK